jgi:hypothetical protein
MSEQFGLRIQPGDGGKAYYLDSDRAQTLSLIQTIAIDGWENRRPYSAKSFHIPEAKDFHILIIPIRTVIVGQWGNVSAINERTLESFWMDGEYLNIRLNFSLDEFSGIGGNVFYLQVCGYPKNRESFGIRLAGMNGVSTLSDQNRLGYCVYRGKFTLGEWGKWRVPDSVPNRSQCLVFARTETSGAAIGMDRDKVIVNGRTPCEVSVVVFSSGFPLQKPDYGVAIYNSAGQMTYTSQYTPFFLGEMIAIRNGSGSAKTITKPMVQVNQLASLVESRGKGYFNIWNSGFSFSGNQIWISRTNFVTYTYFQRDRFSADPINYDIYAINYDDYF